MGPTPMPPWHAPKGRCNRNPGASVMVAVQQEATPTIVRDSMVSYVLQQLSTREPATAPPTYPQLVDIQAAVPCRDHSSRATFWISCEARDRFADQETPTAERVILRYCGKGVQRASTFPWTMMPGGIRSGSSTTTAAAITMSNLSMPTRKCALRCQSYHQSIHGREHRIRESPHMWVSTSTGGTRSVVGRKSQGGL